jgi:hypothetical protein
MEERRGAYGFWWGILNEADYLEDLGVGRRMKLKLILKKIFGRAWTGSMCHRTWISGRLLWMR